MLPLGHVDATVSEVFESCELSMLTQNMYISAVV